MVSLDTTSRLLAQEPKVTALQFKCGEVGKRTPTADFFTANSSPLKVMPNVNPLKDRFEIKQNEAESMLRDYLSCDSYVELHRRFNHERWCIDSADFESSLPEKCKASSYSKFLGCSNPSLVPMSITERSRELITKENLDLTSSQSTYRPDTVSFYFFDTTVSNYPVNYGLTYCAAFRALYQKSYAPVRPIFSAKKLARWLESTSLLDLTGRSTSAQYEDFIEKLSETNLSRSNPSSSVCLSKPLTEIIAKAGADLGNEINELAQWKLSGRGRLWLIRTMKCLQDFLADMVVPILKHGPANFPLEDELRTFENWRATNAKFSEVQQECSSCGAFSDQKWGIWTGEAQITSRQRFDQMGHAPCHFLYHSAFASHPRCYVEGGLGKLAITDYPLIFLTVNLEDLVTPEALQQVGSVLSSSSFWRDFGESSVNTGVRVSKVIIEAVSDLWLGF
jgi:hypothetical protein